MRYLLLFFPFAIALAQPQQSPSANPSGIEVNVSASWYQPKLDQLNQAYANLEQALGYRLWGKSSIAYFVNAQGLYPLFPRQYVVVEFGGSVSGRVHQDDHSLVSIWRGGAGYRYGFLDEPLRVSAQGTLGYIREGFSRSYDGGNQSINAAKGTWYLTVLGVASYPLLRSTSLELTLGYAFVPSVTMTTPATKVDLKAPIIGLGLAVSVL